MGNCVASSRPSITLVLMSTQVQPRSLTYQQERGKLLPTRNHARSQANLLADFLPQKQFSIYSEVTLTIDGVDYTPDISIYHREASDYRHDEIKRTELPLVAVEILSPSREQEAIEKAEVYLQHGIKSCWIVSPPLQTVTILLPAGRQEVFHGGSVKDPVIGLTADLTRVFS